MLRSGIVGILLPEISTSAAIIAMVAVYLQVHKETASRLRLPLYVKFYDLTNRGFIVAEKEFCQIVAGKPGLGYILLHLLTLLTQLRRRSFKLIDFCVR